MPMCPFAAFYPNDNSKVPFPTGAPFGIVLHRTVAGWHVAEGFRTSTNYPHFLVGKKAPDKSYGAKSVDTRGGVIQYKDTAYQAAHMRGENAKYIGIEFESIADEKTYNADPLTPYQVAMGRLLIDWLCETHGIHKVGPPPNSVVRILNRSFHGILNHADIQAGHVPGATSNHGDKLAKDDFVALGVEPYPLMTM